MTHYFYPMGVNGDGFLMHFPLCSYLQLKNSSLPDGKYIRGCLGFDVTIIQRLLYDMGFRLPVDGFYCTQTEEIIKSIQLKFPYIKADGVYNRDTRECIKKLINKNYRIVNYPHDTMVLVNKHNALPHYFVPDDLKIPDIPFSFAEDLPKRYLQKIAASSLEKLVKEAGKNKLNLAGVSGYRAFERQAEIFRDYYRRAPDEAVKFSARPGESEHQTGLAMDLSCPSVSFELEQIFGETDEGKWLKYNAHHFGFIIRYPKCMEHITGYQYEPWHVRYVGIKAAHEIASQDITLEEYIVRMTH